MGLDNGICIKGVTRAELPFPEFVYPFSEDYGDVEVCYWRKWWGFRNRVVDRLRSNDDEEQYEYTLTIEDVRFMCDLLGSYLQNPERYEEQNGYWEFNDVKNNILITILNLCVLIDWMKNNPDKQVYFYDSY